MNRENESEFFDWYNHASESERYLFDRVSELGVLFDDMLFRRDTCTYKLTVLQIKDSSDRWISVADSVPADLEYFAYECFRFKVEELGDSVVGRYNQAEQTLSITPSALDNDTVILHEMIHLHEHVLDELPMLFHDMVYWALYANLKTRISRLDEIISNHAHLLNQRSLYEEGGCHDILFLLKSFDLDIKRGLPLGTVFGYGRIDDFKKYSYNINIER